MDCFKVQVDCFYVSLVERERPTQDKLATNHYFVGLLMVYEKEIQSFITMILFCMVSFYKVAIP